jgi:hypothetical protein
MSVSTKLHHLKSKVSELQNQYQQILKEREHEIAVLLSTIELAHLDDKTLLGGLLFLKDKITTQDPIMEVWYAAGEKFLRQHKSRSLLRYQPHERNTRAKRNPQAADKKDPPSKQTYTPQATPESPQRHSQQGKE